MEQFDSEQLPATSYLNDFFFNLKPLRLQYCQHQNCNKNYAAFPYKLLPLYYFMFPSWFMLANTTENTLTSALFWIIATFIKKNGEPKNAL